MDGLTVTSTTGQSHGPPRCVRAGLGPSWWPSAWGGWEGGRVLAVLPGRVDQWSAGGQSAGKAHCMELSDHFQAERSLSQQPLYYLLPVCCCSAQVVTTLTHLSTPTPTRAAPSPPITHTPRDLLRRRQFTYKTWISIFTCPGLERLSSHIGASNVGQNFAKALRKVAHQISVQLCYYRFTVYPYIPTIYEMIHYKCAYYHNNLDSKFPFVLYVAIV